MVTGRKKPMMPIDTTAPTRFMIVKLRSRKSSNGTSGSSSWCRAW